MPFKSKQQRKAMFAAASGKSTLGIPAKVGKEFVTASKGEDMVDLPTTAPKPTKPKALASNFGFGRGARVSERMNAMREESHRVKRARILASHKLK